MESRLRVLAVSIACLISQFGTAADFQGLGAVEGSGNHAYAISADGSTVVGISFATTGPSSLHGAFRWTQETGVELLGPADGMDGTAFGVSGDGSVIVGYGTAGAFVWSESVGVSFPGLYNAKDVSADGLVVVGTVYSAEPSGAAFWTATTGVAILPGVPEAPHIGEALGISADGSTIVGTAATGDTGQTITFEAAAWLDGSAPVILGAGPTSSAHAASADGSVIVGQYFVNNQYRAFRWTQSDGFQHLPEPTGSVSDMRAFAVSADGSIVVGEARNTVTNENEAFVWDAEHGTRRIKDILAGVGQVDQWSLLDAWGISANGRFVAGIGTNPSGLPESWIADLQPASVTELLAALLAEVIDVGPDRKLQKIVTLTQTYYEAGDEPATCAQLTYFNTQVKKLPPKKASQEQKDNLIGRSTAIMEAIGCP